MDKLWRRYWNTVLIIILSMSIANIGPLYVYVRYGQKVTLTSLAIPFIEENSDMEFVMNCTIQGFYGLFFFFANISLEGVALLYGDSIQLPSKLIQMELANMTMGLELGRYTKRQMKAEMVTVYRQIEQVNVWIREHSEMAYWRYFISPVVFTYAIGLCVFCQYIVSILFFLYSMNYSIVAEWARNCTFLANILWLFSSYSTVGASSWI